MPAPVTLEVLHADMERLREELRATHAIRVVARTDLELRRQERALMKHLREQAAKELTFNPNMARRGPRRRKADGNTERKSSP